MWHATEQKALIDQALGISYRQMNNPQEASKYYQESMELSKRLGMQRLLANNLSELAQVQTTVGKPDAAMASYTQALQTLRGIGNKQDYGDILVNRGVLYQTRGDYDQALQDYKDSLQIQREIANENSQAVCLNNIGATYFAKGDTDNALIYLQQSLELRRQLNQPAYLAETLSSLGEVYSAIGDYDKSLSNLMGALEASRNAGDASTAAGVSQLIGTVLMAQGRLGAAVNAMQDAVKGYRSANNYSLEMFSALNGLAGTLALAGRGNESGSLLVEAQGIALDLKNRDVNSELANTQGDVAFYQGDLKSARAAYQQALTAATKAKQRDATLIAKSNLARVAIAEGHSGAAANDLRSAIQQAESLHLKYYAVRGTADLAQALLNSKDYAHAREQLDASLGQSERLGLRLESARIHLLLADVLRVQSDGSSEAARQYRQARSSFEDLSKEPGAEHLLDRFDLRLQSRERP